MRYKLKGNNYTFIPIDTIFENRNIKDYKSFLNLEKSDEEDYNNLINIDEGINLLYKHIKNNSIIHIVVDCDVDGYTSSAVLYNYLKSIYKDINITYTVHEFKKHGLSDDIKINDNAKLIILPDASSNDFKQHKELKNKGVDLLVLDHHEVESNKISEDAVIINNQLSPKYKNKNLSGVGIVYKFINAFNDYIFETRDKVEIYLDLVALGNVGDSMSMYSRETRFYVKEGLKNVHNNFLKALIKENAFQLANKYNIISLGWVIAPKINGVIRTGSIEDKKAVFEALTNIRSDYDVVAKLCKNIKDKQDKVVKAEMKLIEKQIDSDKKYLLLNVNSNLEQSYTGLVANKLKSKYKAPTLLYRNNIKKEGVVGGSARGYEGLIKDLKETLIKSGLFEFCEGHANSFGFEIKRCNIDKLKIFLEKELKDKDVLDGEEYEVDLVFNNDEIDQEIIEEICKYEDEWGNGIDEPLFVFNDIELEAYEVNLLGSRAKNIVFYYNNVKFIKKYAKMDLYNQLIANEKCKLNLIGKCVNNFYNGEVIPQVEIVDIEIK